MDLKEKGRECERAEILMGKFKSDLFLRFCGAETKQQKVLEEYTKNDKTRKWMSKRTRGSDTQKNYIPRNETTHKKKHSGQEFEGCITTRFQCVRAT